MTRRHARRRPRATGLSTCGAEASAGQASGPLLTLGEQEAGLGVSKSRRASQATTPASLDAAACRVFHCPGRPLPRFRRVLATTQRRREAHAPARPRRGGSCGPPRAACPTSAAPRVSHALDSHPRSISPAPDNASMRTRQATCPRRRAGRELPSPLWAA